MDSRTGCSDKFRANLFIIQSKENTVQYAAQMSYYMPV